MENTFSVTIIIFILVIRLVRFVIGIDFAVFVVSFAIILVLLVIH